MTTIPLGYYDTGFQPSSSPAAPGDLVVITNYTQDDIELTYAAGQVVEPLIGMWSPTTVPGGEGQVQGTINVTASSHVLVFYANSYEANLEIGPASHEVTFTPESASPSSLDANPLDIIVFYNRSGSDSVTIDVDSSTSDPLGPELGMNFSIDPGGTKDGIVQVTARNTKIKLTVKGSSGATTSISVGSGDVENVVARTEQAPGHCG